jgi:2'-5' RNA ligase
MPATLPSPPRAACAPGTARLFIALWPGAQARRALAAARDATGWAVGAAPTATDKLHLTLHFIGSVPAFRVPQIAAALQVPMRGFDLHLDEAECWRGGLAVLPAGHVPRGLLQLHADLAVVLQQLALPVERRAFRPHVTLARRTAPSQALAAIEPVRWRVTGYALVQSTADGRYVLLRRYGAVGRSGRSSPTPTGGRTLLSRGSG